VIHVRAGTFTFFRRIIILPDHSFDVAVIVVFRYKATVIVGAFGPHESTGGRASCDVYKQGSKTAIENSDVLG